MIRAATILLVLAVAGCTPYGPGFPGETVPAPPASDEDVAAGNVRAAVPAIEAYYADNASYAGVSLKVLRSYDHGIARVRVAVSPDGQSYCLSSTVGAATASKAGPAGDIQAGDC